MLKVIKPAPSTTVGNVDICQRKLQFTGNSIIFLLLASGSYGINLSEINKIK
jgi:hypothetical protein